VREWQKGELDLNTFLDGRVETTIFVLDFETPFCPTREF
jgi:hypothetical protein